MSVEIFKCKVKIFYIKLVRDIFKYYSFLFCSFFAVSIDLCVFQLGIFFAFPVVTTNIISSAIAITANYYFLSKVTFNQHLSAYLFLIFFLYYSVSVFLFSLVISFMVGMIVWSPLLCKILLLPVSFLVNFYFSNLILGKRRYER